MSATAEFSLLEAFKQIPDPRKRRGVRHPFHALLTLAATAYAAFFRCIAGSSPLACSSPRELLSIGCAGQVDAPACSALLGWTAQ